MEQEQRSLMLTGDFFKKIIITKDALAFDSTFGSLRRFELRPAGFSENDLPHMCENLACKGIEFSYQYILKITMK